MSDALIYAGRINPLQGEPGGGKTWVALHACVEAITEGHHVMYIDLEDHPSSVFARMLTLGADKEDIRARFHYVNPENPMGIDDWDVIERNIKRDNIAIVVIDSIGELLSMQGIRSSNDDDEVAKLYRLIPRRIAKLGPAVILLDHVTKANSSDGPQLWAIGSQRKKAAVDGAAYMVETIKAFAAGQDGKIALRTAKDRNGNFVVGHVVAEIHVSSSQEGDRLKLDVRAPQMSGDGTHQRQTTNMRRVTEWLAEKTTDSAGSRNEIQRGTEIHDRYMTTVLRDLVAEGWVNKYSSGPGKADRYCLIERFDEFATPPNQRPNDGTF